MTQGFFIRSTGFVLIVLLSSACGSSVTPCTRVDVCTMEARAAESDVVSSSQDEYWRYVPGPIPRAKWQRDPPRVRVATNGVERAVRAANAHSRACALGATTSCRSALRFWLSIESRMDERSRLPSWRADGRQVWLLVDGVDRVRAHAEISRLWQHLTTHEFAERIATWQASMTSGTARFEELFVLLPAQARDEWVRIAESAAYEVVSETSLADMTNVQRLYLEHFASPQPVDREHSQSVSRALCEGLIAADESRPAYYAQVRSEECQQFPDLAAEIPSRAARIRERYSEPSELFDFDVEYFLAFPERLSRGVFDDLMALAGPASLEGLHRFVAGVDVLIDAGRVPQETVGIAHDALVRARAMYTESVLRGEWGPASRELVEETRRARPEDSPALCEPVIASLNAMADGDRLAELAWATANVSSCPGFDAFFGRLMNLAGPASLGGLRRFVTEVEGLASAGRIPQETVRIAQEALVRARAVYTDIVLRGPWSPTSRELVEETGRARPEEIPALCERVIASLNALPESDRLAESSWATANVSSCPGFDVFAAGVAVIQRAREERAAEQAREAERARVAAERTAARQAARAARAQEAEERRQAAAAARMRRTCFSRCMADARRVNRLMTGDSDSNLGLWQQTCRDRCH